MKVAVELNEVSVLGLAAGTAVSSSGKAELSLDCSLNNVLGCAERFSVLLGSQEAASSPMTFNLGKAHPPRVQLESHVPLVLGTGASVSLRASSGLDAAISTAAYAVSLRDVEASVSSESGSHTVTLLSSLRQLVPVRRTLGAPAPDGSQHRQPFALSASSAQVAAECDASVKNGIAYTYAKHKMTPSRAVPANGHVTSLRVEAAGLGGSISHLKVLFNGSYARSLWRAMPDTGFELPATLGNAETIALKPARSGRDLARALGVVNSARSGSPLLDLVAGWSAGGITAQIDLCLGLLAPLGGAQSRVLDRFHSANAQSALRGFESIGPRAAPSGGDKLGDALGGDVLAVCTARLLLPPPLPSVRAVRNNVRSYAFATVGALCPNLTRSATPLRDLRTGTSAALGLGLVRSIPFAAGRRPRSSPRTAFLFPFCRPYHLTSLQWTWSGRSCTPSRRPAVWRWASSLSSRLRRERHFSGKGYKNICYGNALFSSSRSLATS
jgi:hypothetical protein